MSATILAPEDHGSTALTISERHDLDLLEATIDRGLKSFIEVGQALGRIRAERLYRQSHGTFETYCQDRWNIGRQRASELIGAADVAIRVSEISDIQPRESHADALKALPDADQPDAWQEAVATAPNGKVTAAHVETVVAARIHSDAEGDADHDQDADHESGTDCVLHDDGAAAAAATTKLTDDERRKMRGAIDSLASHLHIAHKKIMVLYDYLKDDDLAELQKLVGTAENIVRNKMNGWRSRRNRSPYR